MKLFVDNLTVIDCSLLSPEAGLTGMSWMCDIELEGNLDDQSMVMDFGLVKKQIKAWIDDGPDHRLVVARGMEGVSITQENETHQRLTYKGTVLLTPEQGIYAIEGAEVTAENLGVHLSAVISEHLSEQGIQATIRLRAEEITGPHYCYSHGLKKHDGNCQRIAHGHRSKIEIWQNDALAMELMQGWATEWQDIYLGSKEDLIEESESHLRFAYEAPQGYFELTLPHAKCWLLESDSTVECIASHIAATLKSQHPDSHFRVKAYEGVQKGAIAEA